MHATDTDFSPGWPSSMTITRRRFTPQGTSCSFLHAVTHAWHSMQRSASQRNFILAMLALLYLVPWLCGHHTAQRGLGFLHHRDRVIAVGRRRVGRLATGIGRGTLGVLGHYILAL